jgi:hypothetical protein
MINVPSRLPYNPFEGITSHMPRSAVKAAHIADPSETTNVTRFSDVWNDMILLPNVSDQPRGAGSDGVADTDESLEDGRLPALCCGDWIGSFRAPRISSSALNDCWLLRMVGQSMRLTPQ